MDGKTKVLVDFDKMVEVIHEHYEGYGIDDMIRDIKKRAIVEKEEKTEG